MWLTRDDVTRGTTLFQSPYDSALFYVYSICYTNIQLNALTFDKCFSSEDSHTEISKRFAWNALSRWHFISASLHLLYLHMFIAYNQKYYCINTYICQRRDFLDSFEKFSLPFKTGRLTWKSKFQCKSKFHRDLNFVDLTRDFWTKSLVFCYN